MTRNLRPYAVAEKLYQASDLIIQASRILDERHFEFRGGWYRGGETELRTRASDPAFNGPI